ncbi:MAG: arsenosugar biosynthesis radical SAM protein ArsS [Acidobacteria bacterium]|nr:arsenosugar biosynthesis radical SAM protein ArsS [Acidobacteriota bacterium]
MEEATDSKSNAEEGVNRQSASAAHLNEPSSEFSPAVHKRGARQYTPLPVLNDSSIFAPHFEDVLLLNGLGPLRRTRTVTFQVNVGKRCNQACHHCHVEAGPKRTEMMSRRVAERVLAVLDKSPVVQTVDLTGGAPELNPNFRLLVTESRRLGRHVIDRCNLTVFFEPGMEDLDQFLAEHQVEIVASLPCYTAANVDKQRGLGVFEKSIEALQRLNRLGYGLAGSPLILNLVYNPLGTSLPPPQQRLEIDYRRELHRRYSIEFHNLYTLTNMPIRRFAAYLEQSGKYSEYMGLLANHFNPETVPQLMCLSLVSMGWNGKLYDCDFNQMLEIELGAGPQNVWEIDSLSDLSGKHVNTAHHCFGCTAGAGSSCGGALSSTGAS